MLNRSEQEVNIHFVDFAHVWLCPHLSSSTKCSSHPSPVRAQQAWMCHWWSLTEVSWRLWEISATDMQPFTSCLLAKINSPAFLKSWRRDKRHQKRRKTFNILPVTRIINKGYTKSHWLFMENYFGSHSHNSAHSFSHRWMISTV